MKTAQRETCGAATVTCRLTHAYPRRGGPYFTVLAPARRGSELEQWDAIKAAASAEIIAAGATITHDHAVGRDHCPWYDCQRPSPTPRRCGLASERSTERDLNPVVLIDPA